MKQIYMIEDNEDHALLIRRAIEDRDCMVTHFQDGLDFLKEVRRMSAGNGRPDLVLLDLKLPGLDGLEVLRQFKQVKSFEQVPVVILTTSRRREEVECAYQSGAAGFLAKSEDFAELMTKLQRVRDYWLHTVEAPYLAPMAKAGET